MLQRLREELRSPFNLITGTIGILGFIWGFYTWYTTKQTAMIAYGVEQVQLLDVSRIVPGTQPSEKLPPFKVFDSNDEPINQNIYGANVTIWNAGDVDLGRERVRRPVSVMLGDGVKIIDYSIEHATDPKVTEFSVSLQEKNSLDILWKYFDPSAGLRVRVIYISATQSEVLIDGNIYGVKNFTRSRKGEKSSNVTIFVIVGLLGAFYAFGFDVIAKLIGFTLGKLGLHGWRAGFTGVFVAAVTIIFLGIAFIYIMGFLTDIIDGPRLTPPF